MSAMAPRLEVFEGHDVYRQHAERWTELLASSQEPPFFLRADWLDAWSRHFAQDRRCFLAAVEQDGRWIGGLPLTLGSGKLGARWRVSLLEFAGTPFFDRVELPAANPEELALSLETILDWARRDLGAWTVCGLREVPTESATFAALRTWAKKAGTPLYSRLCSKAPVVDLETGGKTSSKYRRQLRQSMEHLRERGEVALDFFYPAAEQVDELIRECAAVEVVSWKGEAGVGLFQEGPRREFFRELWKAMGPRKEVALATIRLDGKLIIYHWGFLHHGVFLSYSLAQVPETNNVRGGSLLLKHMVDEGLSLGIRAIDASRGSLESPNIIGRYHGPIRDHQFSWFYNSNLSGSALRMMRHGAVPLARKILGKPDPGIEAL